jgi:hypothetical protein
MIQRIQTLFLLIASGAIFGQFGVPYLQTPEGNTAHNVPQLADGILNPFDNFGLLGLTLLGGLVTLLAVFMFRNRPLQSRLAGGSLVISIFILVLAGIVTNFTMKAIPEGGSASFGAGWALPIIAIINQWLAARSIRKDEELVKSMDRLR